MVRAKRGTADIMEMQTWANELASVERMGMGTLVSFVDPMKHAQDRLQ
jgi:hypothetical protein